MTSKVASSTVSQIKVNIPQGWFFTQDNENERLDLWLVREDYGASINLTPINLDEKLNREIAEAGIQIMVKASHHFSGSLRINGMAKSPNAALMI